MLAEIPPQELTKEQKESLLTDKELREYRIYMRLNQPPMAPSAQSQFFNLFLGGINCEEIHRINPGGFSLGAIVRARIENNWDEKRIEHQRALASHVRENVQQTILETVEQLALELKVHNKLKRDKLLRFLQTGDEAELAGLQIGSTKNLKEVAEALLKLTGQDDPKKPQQVDVHHHVVAPVSTALPVVPAGKPIPEKIAAEAIEVIHKQRGGK